MSATAAGQDGADNAVYDTAPRTVVAGSRQIGYRRFGTGPAVVLLHASPRSSAALVPLGLRLADRFTVFALDTPGFGWSDPLPLDRPDAQDYAAALVEAFDALGLDRVPVYGSHTGAAIAVAAAVARPDRVSCLALDGYAAFDPATQAEFLASYLAPIEPQWDGTHLAWLWGRVKDQFTVFPWHWRAQPARLGRPLAPLGLLQAVVQDFLAAGDHYRHAYAAAFRYDHVAGLRAVQVPVVAMARSDDLLFEHLDRLTGMPDTVSVRRLGSDDAQWAEAMAAALAVGAGRVPPAPVAPPAAPGVLAVHRVPGGTIGLIRQGTGAGRPLVLLPPIPGSARGLVGLARALAVTRPVVTLDLPGFGASALRGAPDAAGIAAALLAALRAGDVGEFDVAALRESGAIGAALARAAPGAGLVLLDPVPDALRAATLEQMVDASARIDGIHLLAAWHQLRDAALWRPWFLRDPEHAIDAGLDPDVPALQAVLTDWMRGGAAARRTLAAAMDATLDGLPAATSGTGRHEQAAAILHALRRS